MSSGWWSFWNEAARAADVPEGSGMVRRGQVQTYDTTAPTSDDVEKGYKTYREHGCKSIVALGQKEVNPLSPVPLVWARKDFRRLIESIRK